MAVSFKNPPLRVVVTGAAGDVGSSLSLMVAQGKVFGVHTMIELVMTERPNRLKMMEDIAAELAMCCLKPVAKYTCTTNLAKAFTQADVIFLCNGVSFTAHLSLNEFIGMNALEFKTVGQAMHEAGLKTNSRILMVSEPQNSNMRVVMHYAPSIKVQNIMGLSRVDQNRAKAFLARKFDINIRHINRLTVWGNRSENIFIDVRHAEVEVRGEKRPAYDVVDDIHFIENDFNAVVNLRREDIERSRKTSICLPVATAAVQHMKEWLFGTQPKDDWSSAIVVSDGSYQIKEGIPYSFPVRINTQGIWEIVQGLDFNEKELDRIQHQEEEINTECDLAYIVLDLKKKNSDEDDEKLIPWAFGDGLKIPCSMMRSPTGSIS